MRSAHGAASYVAAIADWLATKPEHFDLELADWQPSLLDTNVYEAGAQQVSVDKIDPPGSGYVVISGTTCR